jgi:hypothetical protein
LSGRAAQANENRKNSVASGRNSAEVLLGLQKDAPEGLTVQLRVKVFETDIPPQHLWEPTMGKYKVLWERTFKAEVKAEK